MQVSSITKKFKPAEISDFLEHKEGPDEIIFMFIIWVLFVLVGVGLGKCGGSYHDFLQAELMICLGN